jgi:toxin ParE1/3/4
MYEVQWTSLAKEDLISAIAYISDMLKASAAAEKLLNDIEKETAVLAENPYLFPLSHDEHLAHRGIRHVVVKNYMLFYTVNEDAGTVTIIRMLYARRDWIQLLGDVSCCPF